MVERPGLSVVAPLYQNAPTLPELVARVRASLQGKSWELILVDDAAPDGAGRLAQELAAGDARLRVVLLAQNVGQQEALRAGILASRGERVALIDADLQDPPEVLPVLWAASRNVEVLFGVRRGQYQSWPRRVSSKLYKTLRSWLCRLPAGAGLLLVADGELLRRIAHEAPQPIWILPQLGACRPSLAAVDVERMPRPQGESAYRGTMRWKVAFAELREALRLRRART